MTSLTALLSIMFFPAGITLILSGMLYEWADRKLVARFQNRIGPRWYALAAPVVVNGLGVAAMLALVLDLPFWASVVWVSAGEAAVMATGGAVVLMLVRRRGDLFGIMRPDAG